LTITKITQKHSGDYAVRLVLSPYLNITWTKLH